MRVVLFYVMEAVIMLSAPFVPNLDRMHYQLSIPVICMQILFAHLYPVAGNVVLFVVVHTRLLYSALRDTDASGAREDKYSQAERQAHSVHSVQSAKNVKERRDDSQTELMALLHAAKAANGSNGAL